MMTYQKIRFGKTTAVCALLLLSPLLTQAASDEDLAAMRVQLQALSQRLDRLESENRALTSSMTDMAMSARETTIAEAAVPGNIDATLSAVKEQTSTSDWTDRMHWLGDFRYRFESFDIGGQPDRNRNRIRARAALIADVNATTEIGLGLASGGDDPVSSNQTLGGGGSSKELRIDLAYFDWSGLANSNIYGGKFKNYIHRSGNNGLLWDSDWRPEGTGIKWDNGLLFANGLGTWIESDSKKEQSFAYLTQAGFKIPVGDAGMLTAGIAYHHFETRGNGSFFGDDDDFFGNSFDPVTHTYLYDYEEVELFADLDFKLFGQPVRVFANHVQNQAVDDNDTAYAFGFNFAKAKYKGQWDVAYVYQKLEADSVLGLLTDSDFGGGGTDSKGHIIKGNYAIVENINAGLTYFINEVGLQSGDSIDFNRLQVDLSFKY